MRRSLQLGTLLIINVLGAAATVQRTPVRIAVITASEETNPATQMRRALPRVPEVGSVAFFTLGAGAARLPRDSAWRAYDAVMVDITDDSTRALTPIIRAASAVTRVIVFNDSARSGTVALAQHPWLARYWKNHSVENYGDLLRYVAIRIVRGDAATTLTPPRTYPSVAFYHPSARTLFATADEYLSWYRTNSAHRFDPAKPNVGILFNMGVYRSGVQQAIDSLIRTIERRGANAFALPADGAAPFSRAFLRNGTPIIDVLIFHGERLNLKSYEQGLTEARTLGLPIVNALVHYRMTPAELRAAPATIAPDLTAFVVTGERDGVFEPLVIAGHSTDTSFVGVPATIKEQIDWRVDRALAWARLHRIANADKRVALTFWSEGAGKSDVGGDPDDFLDVPGSLERMLHAMRDRGYNVGSGPIPNRDTLARWMARNVSNVGSWAPGELADRVARQQVALIPEQTYLTWFNALPAKRRAEIVDVWGPPPGKVMTYVALDGSRSIVIPRIQLGNVIIAPHPAWGYQMDDKVLMSDGAVPPHHEYLAFFLWLQKTWKADAWVSMFTNIVLEPGKGEGPLTDDHIGILLGGLPHIHPERLGDGGGVSNGRKALADIVSWYNEVAAADASSGIAELRARASRFPALRDTSLVASAAAGIRALIDSLNIATAMGVTRATPMDSVIAHIHRYADRLDREITPHGSKVLGDVPRDTVLADMVRGMLGVELTRALGGSKATDTIGRDLVRQRVLGGPSLSTTPRLSAVAESLLAIAPEYARRLREAPRELTSVLAALEGHYLDPGPSEEPSRRPDAVPPGRSMYTFDPRTLPTPEAEALGNRMADDMIRAHRDKNGGSYPTRFAFVLWAGEVTKNYGVVESQVFRLLGVKPVRNSRGEVVDVALIPRSQLGRPRIDIMVVPSGVYRDHFRQAIDLMSKAVRLAESSPEDDNAVAKTTRTALAGIDTSRADVAQLRMLASARVFTSAPDAYGPSISFLARAGDIRGDDKLMADVFSRQMSFAYGGGLDGASARPTFERQLGTLDGASLSRSGAVNALFDNPAPASFLGGINLVTRAVRGRGADLFITNVLDTSDARVLPLREALKTELDTRYFNPKWLAEMKTHGYDGARNMMFMVEQLDLWNATSPEAVTSADWGKVNSVYVEDELGLDLDTFFDTKNPHAQQVVLANLLGAAERGYWSATPEQIQRVSLRLTRSVAAHGNSCDAVLCRNETMTKFMETSLARVPGGPELIKNFRASVEVATGRAPGVAAPAPAASVPASNAAPAAATPPAPSANAPTEVRGRVMTESSQPATAAAPTGVLNRLRAIPAVVLMLLVLAGWLREARVEGRWSPSR